MRIKKLKLLASLIFLVSCTTMQQKESIEQLPNGNFSLKYDHISIEIDPDLGGRVISAKLDDQELLLQERKELLNWGSTFWLAPQKLWNWPPPAAIHLGSYTAKIHGDSLKLTSEIDEQFACRVSKTFLFNEDRNCLEIEYRIINEADTALEVGPWEITVVPAKGAKVFFARGEEPIGANSNLVFEDKEGIAWFDYDDAALMDAQKIYNNATQGWLAHINGDMLFVKSFDIIPANSLAPGQGNVEVYVSKKFEYIELENHGKYLRIPAGDSLTYKVKWYFRKLPAEIQKGSYSVELINFVRKVVN
jgi:hypothetical protein